MTIEEAKDQAAQELGYVNYLNWLLIPEARSKWPEIHDRAMEIYAKAKAIEFAEWMADYCFEEELKPVKLWSIMDEDGLFTASDLYDIKERESK